VGGGTGDGLQPALECLVVAREEAAPRGGTGRGSFANQDTGREQGGGKVKRKGTTHLQWKGKLGTSRAPGKRGGACLVFAAKGRIAAEITALMEKTKKNWPEIAKYYNQNKKEKEKAKGWGWGLGGYEKKKKKGKIDRIFYVLGKVKCKGRHEVVNKKFGGCQGNQKGSHWKKLQGGGISKKKKT